MNPSTVELVSRTLLCAATALLAVTPPGLALAWALARYRFPGRAFVETLIMLPLVAPPVATGLVLLRLFGRRGALGGFLHDRLGLDVVFTSRGVVLAMAVMALPLFVRTARVAFEGVEPRLEQVARTLGASRTRAFLGVTLPLAARGLAAAALLAGARALGEFGATILVAGAIPGRTETLAVAIYQRIQLGRDDEANTLLLLSLAVAFAATAAAETLGTRQRRPR